MAKLTRLRPVTLGYVCDPARPIIPLTMTVRQAVGHAPHRHPRGQLLYAGRGVMRVVAGGGRWVVPPSQAVWLPPETEHEVWFPGEVLLHSLFVDPSAVEGLPEHCAVLEVVPLLRELILRTAEVGEDYGASGPEMRLMRVILDELLRARQARLHLPMPQDARVRRVTEGLITEPGDNRTLDAWSETACTGPRTLARLFVRETGLTFGAWRQRLRLMEAVDRLGAGQRVTQVAFDLGYESLSAFVEMFRKQLGQPPGRYLRAPLEHASTPSGTPIPQPRRIPR